ncbi:tautomerase family protein [Streptomyces sp. NPDC007251]|uniref:tautomerase family protein n=1 Tax=Streptomyces sp. NPDC007251 TaxID=3154483 RepID=UPI0033C35A42
MPHVSIKHFSRTFTEDNKADLVTAVTQTITRVFGVDADSVSIAAEPVEPAAWTAEVHTRRSRPRPTCCGSTRTTPGPSPPKEHDEHHQPRHPHRVHGRGP